VKQWALPALLALGLASCGGGAGTYVLLTFEQRGALGDTITSVRVRATLDGQMTTETFVISDGFASPHRASLQIQRGAGPITVSVDAMAGSNVLDTRDAGGVVERGETLTLAFCFGPDCAAVTPPRLAADPASIDFGVVELMQSRDRTVTVRNGGGGETGVITPTVQGNQFTVTSNDCMRLTMTGTCTITVRLVPIAGGAQAGKLVLTADPGGTLEIPLTGSGLPPADLNINPPTDDFGASPLGVGSTPHIFTITNLGEMPTNALAAAASDDFAVSSNGCGSGLATQASCTVEVVFTPMSGGPHMGTLTITDSVTQAGRVATLSGSGQAPARLDITPATYSFGPVTIGNQSADASFTIRNGGDLASGTPALALSDPSFEIAGGGCPGALGAGLSCTVMVRFKPMAPDGPKMAMLSASATPGGSASATVMGTASLPGALVLTPATANFGNVALGTASTMVDFTLANNGGVQAQALSVAITPAMPEYQLTNNCGATLDPAATCMISVVLRPTSVGVKNATLAVSATGLSTSASLGGSGVAQLDVSSGGSGSGTVMSTPAGINCTPPCGAQFSAAMVTLTASPAPDSMFAGWSGSGCSGTGDCVVAMTGARSVMATFNLRPAQFTIMPATHNYGPIVLNTQSMTQAFVVTNSGATLSSPITTGVSPQFTLASDGCQGMSLAPAGSCTISVRLDPTGSPGARNGTLFVTAGAASTMATLSGSAVALPSLSITPSSQAFASTARGSTSSTVNFMVTNTGGSPTGIPSASMSDANFQIVTSSCTAALAAGASCSIDARFAPASVGAKSGQLTVNASPGGTVAASLSGTGTATVMLTIAGGGTVSSTPAGINCSATCSGVFSTTPVALSATPSGGSIFGGWSGSGCSGTGACSVPLDAATKSVTATFTAGFVLTTNLAPAAGGSVTSSPAGVNCSGSTPCMNTMSGTINLTARPNEGYRFVGWTGACTGSVRNVCSVNMTQARSVTATFATFSHNMVFVSAATVQGNLGNAAAYDTRCNMWATTAGLNNAANNAYIAYISETGNAASARLGTRSGFIRPDGEPIADSTDDLFNFAQIFNAISIDENGASVAPSDVWTGTTFRGAASTNNMCSNWTGTGLGSTGVSNGGPVAWSQGGVNPTILQQACNVSLRIYCFMRTKDLAITIPTPPVGTKRIWIGTWTPGSGIAGANNACATGPRPADASTGRAMLPRFSPGPYAAEEMVISRNTDYYRPDNVLVGSGDALVFGPLKSGVWQWGNDLYDGGQSVITGLTAPNLLAANAAQICNDWTSTSGTTIGGYASSLTLWWNFTATRSCNTTLIYCVEP